MKMSEPDKVEEFNARYEIGQPVVVRRDNGQNFETFTRARAAILGGHAVIWVKGIAGCYSLDRVDAIKSAEERATEATQGVGYISYDELN